MFKFLQTVLLAMAMIMHAPAALADEAKAEYHFSDAEYADLKAYMNYARLALEQTLNVSRTLGGKALHARLLSGVKAALDEAKNSNSDRKQEVLLFTSVLNRALEINDVFVADPKNDAETITSSSVVLLASINSALNYYKNDDVKRIESRLIPAPDWIAFARDQIPVLMRTINFAPSEPARRELALRILSWISRDLNRSVHRRDFAELIVLLGDNIKSLKHGLIGVPEAQNLMLSAQGQISNHLKGNIELATETNVPFTGSQYPGSPMVDANTPPSEPFKFPVIKFHPWKDIEELDHCDDSRCFNAWASAGAGGGGIIEKSTKGFAEISALGHILVGKGIDKDPPAVFDAMAEATGRFGSDRPMYNFRISAGGAAMAVFGLWGVLEASQYATFREQLARGGWNLAVPIIVDKDLYVMVRLFAGTNAINEGPFASGWRNDYNASFGLEAIARYSKFFFRFEYMYDRGKENNQLNDRHEVVASAAIPLGLLLPNDGLRFNVKYVRFRDASGDEPVLNLTQVGGMYEVRW